jgi:O-antigen ligase
MLKTFRRANSNETWSPTISRGYYVAAVFYIFHTIQASDIIDRLVYGEWLGKPGDKITEGLNLLLIVSSLALLARGYRRIRSIRTGTMLALGLVGFLLLSAVWSINPQATMRQGIIYLFVVVGAIGIAGSFEIDEFMKVVAAVCVLAALVSLLLIVVSPSSVFVGDTGEYRGIFSQKNEVGEAMAVGALATLHGLRASKRHRWQGALILAILTIVCFLSESATSLLTIIGLCSVDTVSAMMRKGGIVRILGIMVTFIAVPIVAFIAIFPDGLLDMMGKDPTLTGRTIIWSYVTPYIYQKPLLGWGYAAFWSPNNPAAMEIGESIHWFAPEAHNGLLEILLTVGVVGAALFIFLLARNVELALRCLRTKERALAISAVLCCIGIILVGVSEMVLSAGLEASTPVFFVTGLYCERVLWLRQRRSAATKHFANRYAMPRRAATN